MNNKKVIGIVSYGTFKQLDDFWDRGLEESKKLFSLVGFKPTHIGIKSDTINDGKIKNFNRSEKKVKAAICEGETIAYMTLYALNKGFHTVLDSEFYISFYRNQYKKVDYIYCEMPFEKYNSIIRNQIIDFMFVYIDITKGEIFVMDKNEVAVNYASKGQGDDISKYPTLQILSTF